jgi:hypothetical protein
VTGQQETHAPQQTAPFFNHQTSDAASDAAVPMHPRPG